MSVNVEVGGLFAIFASMLMVTAAVPAGAVPSSTAAGNAGNTTLGVGNVAEPSIDGPPVVTKGRAMATVENLSASNGRLESARDRAVSRLNDSFAYYQGPTRVDDQQVFVHDAVGLRALTAFAGTGENARLRRTVALVASADNRSARRVIRDAESAFEATEASLGPGITNSAGAHIDNARRQLDRAERIRERAQDRDGAQYIRTTARAVRTYGVALNQAQTALDLIDRKTSPQVTLTQRSDPIRNGSERTQYTLVGRVVDPTGLVGTNVTATINDDRTVPLALRGGYTNASFATTINLTERVTTIRVEPSAGADGKRAKRGNGNGHGKSKAKADTGSAVLRLDGDGLPDTYEEKVTGTDPLDPDSDAASTDVNEADNGTIDGHEDFDDDWLSTVRERELGTDPLEADTDGDGLPDGYERFATDTDPLESDSDGDGTPDGQADPDGDGLTNVEEYEAGTSPTYADIDGDKLTDPQELENGTDPFEFDTDDDGLSDGVEPTEPFETDPLAPDTDDDGVEDGNETYTTTASNETLGATVSVTGEGNVADRISVTGETETFRSSPAIRNVSVTPSVTIQTQASFETATITVPFSGATNTSQLSLFRYNETFQTWVPVNTTVDGANGTLEATVEHFSEYRGMNARNYYDKFNSSDPPKWGHEVTFANGTANWTLQSQAGRLSHRNGTLYVASQSNGISADLVVAKDGTADFTRIQPAINAAESGDTVLVKRGTYNENLVLNTSLSLIGQNATLDGASVGKGITIEAPATIRGFTVQDYQYGIFAPEATGNVTITSTKFVGIAQLAVYAWNSTGDWSLSATSFENVKYGIYADEAAGNWSLSSVSFQNLRYDGIDASYTDGNWSLSSVSFQNVSYNGIYADNSAGNWSLSSVSFQNISLGIDAGSAIGKWSLSSISFKNVSSIGINAHDTTGNWSLSSVTFENVNRVIINAISATGNWSLSSVSFQNGGSYAIDAESTVGNWSFSSVSFKNVSTYGIYADGAVGDWTLSSASFQNVSWTGISAYDTTGNWSLSSTSFYNVAGAGINAYETTGNWSLSSLSFKNVSGNGIMADYTVGDWTLSSISFENVNRNGIYADNSGGDWTISSSSFKNISLDGIQATYTDGDWSLSSISLKNVSGDGVYADEAAGNWSLSSVSFINVSDSSIEADYTDGDWSLSSISFEETWSGIFAGDTEGDWSLSSISFKNLNGDGINAYEATGNWSLSSVRFHEIDHNGIAAENANGTYSLSAVEFRSIGASAINARYSWGAWTVTHSSFPVAQAIDAEDAQTSLTARQNWWGQPTGPTTTQVSGPVNTSQPCASPCTPGDVGWNGTVTPPDPTVPNMSDVGVVDHNRSLPESGAKPPANATGGNRTQGGIAIANETIQTYPTPEDGELQVRASATLPGYNSTATIAIRNSTGATIARSNVTERLQTHAFEVHNTSGTQLDVVAIARDGAVMHIDRVTARFDTDGDGLDDHVEPLIYTGSLYYAGTDPMDADTDSDRLEDGEEVRYVRNYTSETHGRSVRTSYWVVNSNPTDPDTDGDQVRDWIEQTEWKIDIIEKNGEPYRWDGSVDREGTGTLNVTSNPLETDTDSDGLSDYEELYETHTNPRDRLTYEIAGEPRGLVMDIKNDDEVYQFPDEHESYNSNPYHTYHASYEALNLPRPNQDLTDATADYDFVIDGSAPQAGQGVYNGPEAFEKLTFTALDGTTRTDTALSNEAELEQGLDPWDPDTDDDGLTDGQEEHWLTRVPVNTGYQIEHEIRKHRTLDTNATQADTDGDGYWDGWIGVHDVGYSEDVILYREHLQDGSGIQGDERVDEQVGIHEVDDDDPGTYLYGNDTKYHSNIHIGELHWEQFNPSQTADPTDPDITPDPQLTVEVDYHSSVANTELVDESLETAERTYQLYGLDIDYVKDQNITKAYPPDGNVDWESLKMPNPVLAGDNEDKNHDIEDSAYMFITYDGGGGGNWLVDEFDWTSDPSGKSSCQGADFRCNQWAGGKLNFGTIVFHKDIAQDTGPYRVYGAKTIVHETGHLIGVGRNDDGSNYVVLPEEIYSGGSSDGTPEYVRLTSQDTKRWSVMSGGWTSEIINPPANGEYIPYSVEELLTIEFNRIDARK